MVTGSLIARLGRLSDSNGIQRHNRLVCKGKLNHFDKLAT